MQQKENKYIDILQQIKRLLALYIEDIRLKSAEKAAMLLSGIAILAIVMVSALLGIVFLAISIAQLLDAFIDTFWSYFIIGAIFIIAPVILISFKTQLVINPIARFVSKLFIDPPVTQVQNKNSNGDQK